jgi:hypothetical protein
VNSGLVETNQSADVPKASSGYASHAQILHAVCMTGLGALIFGEGLWAEAFPKFGLEVAAARIAVVLDVGDAISMASSATYSMSMPYPCIKFALRRNGDRITMRQDGKDVVRWDR